MKSSIYIETDRLYLRSMKVSDAEAAFKFCGDPRVNKYMSYDLYTSVDEARDWINRLNASDVEGYTLGIFLKESNILIGCGSLFPGGTQPDVWKIGYNINYDYWGNGYTVEAMSAIIRYGLKHNHIKCIMGQFAIDNVGSRRVMEKLGMNFYCDSQYSKADGSVTYQSKIYFIRFPHVWYEESK